MRIKICGITTVDDALAVAEAGADAIGLNFVAGPRRIDLAHAELILRELPPFVQPVALVKLAEGTIDASIRSLLEARRVSTVQVYGDVTREAVEDLSWRGFDVIVPTPVRDARFAEHKPAALEGSEHGRAVLVLLDAYDPEKAGGTGQTFRWEWVRAAREEGKLDSWPPILLAGGLTPENVAEAIRMVRPYGVDVSSGVEAEPGRKDMEKVKRFIAAARCETHEG
jgi:phosphoribosylanthranilate isomerase